MSHAHLHLLLLACTMCIGVRDRSGFNLTYLSTGRKYDAGVFEVGHSVTDEMVVPGRAVSYSIFGECRSNCTLVCSLHACSLETCMLHLQLVTIYFSLQNLPTDGITVFANTLHTHLAGVFATTQPHAHTCTQTKPPTHPPTPIPTPTHMHQLDLHAVMTHNVARQLSVVYNHNIDTY